MNKIRIKAWWVQPTYNPGIKVMGVRSMALQKMHDFYADFFLELNSETEDGGATYRVFGNSGQPLQLRGLEISGVAARDLPFGRVMMAGDKHTLWRVARSVEDSGTGEQLVWLLVPDRRGDMDPSFVDPPTASPGVSV